MTAEHTILILRTFYTFKEKGTKTSTKELAEKLGVCQRSIYRFLDQIEIAGIPIIHKQGFNGGLTLIKGGENE